MKVTYKTPEDYISNLDEDRKISFSKLRNVILENLPNGFEEKIQYDMISYVVPKSIYPKGYHVNPEDDLAFLSIASQKNHIALYHMGIYMDEDLNDWFKSNYKIHVKTKLDMGKSCIRFKNTKNIPYNLIGELVSKMSLEEFVNLYENSLNK